MTFAAITPALVIGAFAERLKFSAILAISLLWTALVDCPIAHMVWYWPGPDGIAQAARAVQVATDAAARADARPRLLLWARI